MLDIKPLRYFAAVARTLHFGKAAQHLHISQPPLSRQIAALEQTLGTALFERNAHRVALTSAGEQLFREAQAILTSLERLPENIRAAASGQAGTLTLGFTMCSAYSVIPGLARRFAGAYPRVALKLREVVSNDLTVQLLEGRIDVAVMLPAGAVAGLMQRPVFVEPLCAALPSGHPSASARSFSLADLAQSPFVAATAEVSPGLRRTIEEQCLAAGFVPNIHMEVQLQQTILSLVAEGVGVALVPSSMKKMQVEGVTFRKLAHAKTVEQMMAWPEKTQNPCVRNLLALQGFS
jgi:DNA-binding transcriptional LysR family regulator